MIIPKKGYKWESEVKTLPILWKKADEVNFAFILDAGRSSDGKWEYKKRGMEYPFFYLGQCYSVRDYKADREDFRYNSFVLIVGGWLFRVSYGYFSTKQVMEN